MKPNYLFLIGAPKAGTTSLARAFVDHPEVAVALTKEPRFFTDFAERAWDGPGALAFASTIARDRDSYDAQFAAGMLRMDASTDYLSCSETPNRLAAFAERHPVKVVAVLRDPVSRIISEYQHTLRDGLQSRSLMQSLAAENDRTAAGWQPLFRHLRRSRYAAPLQRYRNLFGSDFHVLDFHDPRGHGALITQLSWIMGVTPPRITRHDNQGFTPRSATLNALMRADAVRRAAHLVVPAEMRGALRRSADRLNSRHYSASPAELTRIRTALAEDIAWCVADPDVPTGQWRMAVGHAVGAAGQISDPSRPFGSVQS